MRVHSSIGRQLWVLAFLFFSLSSLAAAQSTPPSSMSAPPPQAPSSDKPIAAAVRESKTQKNARAKKVFTDDDMDANTGPLPKLKMEGIDNTDQIIAEIGNYRKTHTAEQPEEVLHDWYDEYDSQLAAAIQSNINRSVLMQENQTNGYELCQASG